MKIYTRFLLLVTMVVLVITSLFGAWLDNLPAYIEQPDGTRVDVLLSGDEFYNWAHNSDYYTIVQDAQSGYWCWAMEAGDGNITSTGMPIHQTTPQSRGLPPRINISAELYRQKSEYHDRLIADSPTRTPSMGVVNNLVVFIKFADDPEFEDPIEYYDEQFNATGVGVNSLYQYYWDSSYGQYQVISHYYPLPDGSTILAYTSPNERNYYRPHHADTNPIGYHGENNGAERYLREHALLRDAIEYIETMVPADLIIDSDGDDYVDNVAFLVKGHPGRWSTLLWPHRSTLSNFLVYIHGKRVFDYNFNIEFNWGPEDWFTGGVSTYCHEYAHSMGLPDFYRYNANGNPVGPWDLMANTTDLPQSLSAYAKWRYTGWVDEMPLISLPNVYTLSPLTTSRTNHAYRIASPNSPIEYFVVEYRRNDTGLIDSQLYGSGLLIYRVNPEVLRGNRNGPPDELYVYRPNGTFANQASNSDGSLWNAHFGADYWRTEINDNTNPSSWLSDGTPGGLDISNISFVGETMSFTLGQIVDYDVIALSITGVVTPIVDMPTTFTVRVQNYGHLTASGYSVRLMEVGNSTPLATFDGNTLEFGDFDDVVFNWTPTNIGFTQLYGRTVWVNDENSLNNQTRPLDVYVYQEGATTQTLFVEDFEDLDLFDQHWTILNGDQPNIWFVGTAAREDGTNSIYITKDFGETNEYDINAASVVHFYRELNLPDDAFEIALNFDFRGICENGFDFLRIYLCDDIPAVGVHPPVGTQIGSTYHMQDEWVNRTINIAPALVSGQSKLLVFTWRNDTNTGVQPAIAVDNISLRYFSALLDENDKTYTAKPSYISLEVNYPNPFNPSTTIEFGIGNTEFGMKQAVIIDIYNVKGQKVRSLVNGEFNAGIHKVVWNGTDDTGRTVGSGVYFYRMQTDGFSETKKMILMK